MNDQPILVRQLGLADRSDYFRLRLRGLKAHPESFGQSYEEALTKGPSQHDVMLQGLRAAEGDFLLGAYALAGTQLVGVVGLLRNPSDKQRVAASGARCSPNCWRVPRVSTVCGKSSYWSAVETKRHANFTSRSAFANTAAKSAHSMSTACYMTPI